MSKFEVTIKDDPESLIIEKVDRGRAGAAYDIRNNNSMTHQRVFSDDALFPIIDKIYQHREYHAPRPAPPPKFAVGDKVETDWYVGVVKEVHGPFGTGYNHFNDEYRYSYTVQTEMYIHDESELTKKGGDQ